MKTLLICGSPSTHSRTLALLHHIDALLESTGVETRIWDLSTHPLPVVAAQYHKDPIQNPDKTVQEFVQAVAEAHIIVLGTPLYQGSFSGVLKNALDNLAGNAFAGKWVALAGNAGSMRASHVELVHLRYVVNTMGGYCAQTQIGTCKDDYALEDGVSILSNEEIKMRCQRLVDELMKVTR